MKPRPEPESAAPAFVPKRGRPTAAQKAAISRTILEAATHIFLAEGFEGASMDAIAARASVPKSTLYKRFADKRALLRAVIEDRVSAWSAVASRKNWMLTEDLAQRLKHYGAWVLLWASSPDVRAFSNLALSAWSSADEVDRRQDVIGFDGMVELIARDMATFGPGVGIRPRDPRKVAVALMALLSGSLNMRSSVEPMGEAEAEDIAGTAVDLLMHGSAAW
ncbi:MAG TPA: TetR/AcrR family transcriptional regulator [Sphingobium sp.]|uniref:TetR/AcrR family transcriptional regulator n=1 Tax=Sphingobium sp. TaxID=1912891 RepID=UPI002ED2681D